MLVREERPADVAAIRAVLEEAFPTPDEARLVDALRAAGRLTLSFVAEVDGAVVGHAAFSPVVLPGARDGLGLAPVAVRAAARRRGVAEAMVRAGLARAAELGHGFVVVLGNPHYYRRFGFERASDHGLRDTFGGGIAFQVLELHADALPPTGGLVEYAPEFEAFE